MASSLFSSMIFSEEQQVPNPELHFAHSCLGSLDYETTIAVINGYCRNCGFDGCNVRMNIKFGNNIKIINPITKNGNEMIQNKLRGISVF